MAGKLVLIIGPSGVGKSVIFRALKKKHPECHFPRSATTRSKRAGEKDDVYHFVTNDEFDRLLKNKEFLEWAIIHGQERYGTLIKEILPAIQSGKIVIREVDVQGFDNIRSHEFFCGTSAKYILQSIFILPENKEQLIARIQRRAPIADDELKRRIASMEKEITYADFCNVKIMNKEGKLQEAVQAVERCIFE